MIDTKPIELDLQHMSMQAEASPAPEIQKLSPAQMAALASALGRKHGLNVEFGNFSTAATDGNTILLPLTSRENSWIVRGYLDHETAHVRLTDFGQVPNHTPFRKTLWNVLEDVRIEGLMPLLYPGMASNYRALIRELRSQTPALFDVNGGDPPEAIIATYISLMLRSLYLRQAELALLALNAREVFVETFGEDLEQDLFSLIMRVSNTKSTGGIVQLVDEIIELLQRYAVEPPQNQGQAQEDEDGGDTGEAPEQGSEQADDEAGAEEADGDQGRTDNADEPGEPGDDSGSEQGNDTQASGAAKPKKDAVASGSDIDNGPASPHAAIQQALESQEEMGDLGEQLRDLARDKERAAASPLYEIARPAPANRLRLEGYLPQKTQAASGLVAELSSRLRGLLQAKNLQHATPGMSGNRIARNRLHRIRTGDPHLFLKKSPKKMVNTAVHLLIDNSTSMSEGRRFFQTRESVLALIKAFEPIGGVNLGASIFPAYYPYDGRHTIPVATVLDHNQRPGRTILYPGEPRGETPLGPALRHAVSVMVAVQEPRKILLILTDGEPDCTHDAGDSIQEAAGLGIEVLALGIEQLVYPDIFPHFEIVESARELPKKVFALLEQVLLQHT